jgi:hypothetical protein
MKALAFLLMLLLSAPLRAADPPAITAKEVAGMKSYDAQQLQAQASALSGDVVKVKFTYRLPETTIGDNDSLKGTIGITITNPNGTVREGTFPVLIPKEGRAWFMKVPTATTSRRPFYAIARVQLNENVPQALLLGREVRNDFKGPQLIWEEGAH